MYGRKNWFHSRSSSSETELEAILLLLSRSQNYAGLRWSGNKTDKGVMQFADEIGVNSATMQTKIRAFIRFGFLIDSRNCPLELTDLAKIWMDFRKRGEQYMPIANAIKGLIIASYLSIYSFDLDGFRKSPLNNFRPLYELLSNIDESGFISNTDLERLIAGAAPRNNYTYWKKDLLRSKILEEVQGGFRLKKQYKHLLEAILNTPIPSSLSDSDWDAIHTNILDERNPYKEAILADLQDILTDVPDIEKIITPEEESSIKSREVREIIDEVEATREIQLGDFKIPDTYTKTKRRQKQSSWSKHVKKSYKNECCVPDCDVEFNKLLQASHIKGYAEKESGNGHRANPRNGLCLCKNCHTLMDEGLFTLTDDYKIKLSSKIREKIKSPKILETFLKSENKIISPLPDNEGARPDPDFLTYHRENVFIP